MTVSWVNTRRAASCCDAGQGVVGGLGAAVDRVGDPARAPVAAQRQLIALTAFPGRGHRLGHQRQHPAAQPAPGLVAQLRDHRLHHGGLHHQARLRGRPGHRQPQLGLAHRPDREQARHPAPPSTAGRRSGGPGNPRAPPRPPAPAGPRRGPAGIVAAACSAVTNAFRSTAPCVLARGEQLLELVDHQDQAWRRTGRGTGWAVRSRVRAAPGGGPRRLLGQHRRLIRRRRQRPVHRHRIRARHLGQAHRQLPQRAGRGPDHPPRPPLRPRPQRASRQPRQQPRPQQRGLARPRLPGHQQYPRPAQPLRQPPHQPLRQLVASVK